MPDLVDTCRVCQQSFSSRNHLRRHETSRRYIVAFCSHKFNEAKESSRPFRISRALPILWSSIFQKVRNSAVIHWHGKLIQLVMLSDDTIKAVLSLEARLSHYQVDPVAVVGRATLALAAEVSAMATHHVLHVCRMTGIVLIGVLELSPSSPVNKSSMARVC